MKLKLTIDPPVNGHTYRPAELVQGRIELHYLKKAISEISHVRIVFQGTVRVALKPGFDAASQMAETYRQERYRLFTYAQIVRPRRECREDGSKTDHLVADFDFTFPSVARCCLDKPLPLSCPLPPSVRISSATMDIRIVYTLTAMCRRPGMLHRLLHTRAKARQVLNYGNPVGWTISRSGDTHHPLVCSTAWLPAGKLLGMDATDPVPSGCLSRPPPPYSPTIALDVVLPQPPVLTPGENVVMGLFVRVPTSLLGKAFVRSLTVDLHRITTARVASSVRIDRAAWPLWSVRGRLPLQHQRVSIACGQAVGPAKVYGLGIPASAPTRPGFVSCSVSRAYLLHVRMGVSATGMTTSDIHYTETSIDVDVSGPPPAYGEGGRQGGMMQES